MKTVKILVSSCDKYADLWPFFFSLFSKYWPDCPYDIYLGTNHEKYDNPKVSTICVGEDKSWAINLQKMLNSIDSDYIILFLEDFFLTQIVQTDVIKSLSKIAFDENIDCLRLVRKALPTGYLNKYEYLGEICRGAKFRISTQTAIWEKEFLLSFLHPSFSPWDFEIKGSEVANFIDAKIWGVKSSVVEYKHAVERGKWLPQGIEICDQNDLEPDFGVRNKLTEQEMQRILGRKNNLKNKLTKLLPEVLKNRIRLKQLGIATIIKDLEFSDNC